MKTSEWELTSSIFFTFCEFFIDIDAAITAFNCYNWKGEIFKITWNGNWVLNLYYPILFGMTPS